MAQPTTKIGATIVRDPQLAELVKRLVAAYSPERVFLFGSRARGEVGPDSDSDLLVVVPDDSGAERATSRLGYQALRGTGVAADVVVWRRSVRAPSPRAHVASLCCASRGRRASWRLIQLEPRKPSRAGGRKGFQGVSRLARCPIPSDAQP